MSLSFESVSPDGGPGFETAFVVVFALVGLLVLAGLVFVGYSTVRAARAAKRAGIDPFTPGHVLLAQAIGGGEPRSLEHRLGELDDLHRRGVISADEHRTARAQALARD